MVQTPYKRKRSSLSRKKLLLVLVVLLLIGGGVFYVLNQRGESPDTDPSDSTSNVDKTSGKPKINLDPPTEAQQNAARDTSSPTPDTRSDGKKAVTPVITSYDKQEVRAFVNGIIEDDGTCTATYTHGGDVITATSRGVSDAGHTTCGPMKLAGPLNIQGDWSVVVTYNSSTSYGKSETKTLKVQ